MYHQNGPAAPYVIPATQYTYPNPGVPYRPLGKTNTYKNPTINTGRPRLLFYRKNNPYYGFTNFSPHPVYYKGKRYPTSEHLFQSFKVCRDMLFLFFFSFIVVLTATSSENTILRLQK